jgi:heparanase
MSNGRHFPVSLSVSLAVLGGIFYSVAGSGKSAISVNPASIPRIGTVEERFQSFNVEMLEVTGGRFWKPYKDQARRRATMPPTTGGMSQYSIVF